MTPAPLPPDDDDDDDDDEEEEEDDNRRSGSNLSAPCTPLRMILQVWHEQRLPWQESEEEDSKDSPKEWEFSFV